MFTITLYLGLLFASLLAGLLLHRPSRNFLTGLACLMYAKHPWLGSVIGLGLIFLCVVWQRFGLAIVLEWTWLMGIMIQDRYRSRLHQRQRQLTLAVVSRLLTYLKSGYDLMSALSRLAYAKEPDIASLGVLCRNMLSVGLQNENAIVTHRRWRSNPSLVRFVEQLFSFLKSGANPIPWLERFKAFSQKKVEFRKMVGIKTTQIKLQMYILTIFSWVFFGVVMLLFPGTFQGVLETPVAMLMIVVGLGFQMLGIKTLGHMLASVVTDDT